METLLMILESSQAKYIGGILFVIFGTKALTGIIERQLKAGYMKENKRLNIFKMFDRIKPLFPFFVSLFVAVFFLDLSKDIFSVFYDFGKNVILFCGVGSYFYKVGKTTVLNR